MSDPRQDRLSALEAELNNATERARHLVETTEPRFFTVRPHLSAWSAAECVAHLSITTETFLPILTAAVDDGRKRGLNGQKKPRMDILGSLMRWFLEPPVRSKVKTTARFVPRAVRAKAEALAEFTSMQAKLLELVSSAHDLDLGRMKVASPFDQRFRYNVYSAFRILAAHQRRHLWQAEQAVTLLRKTRDS